MANSKKSKSPKGWSVIFLLVFALGLATVYLFYINSKGWSWTNAAQFGDMFGGVNAIFSGVAIMAMSLSIILQRSDLAAQREAIDLQRKEMVLTRDELAKTATAQEATVKHMTEQAKIMKASASLPHIETRLDNYYITLTNKLHYADFKAANLKDANSVRDFLAGLKLQIAIDIQHDILSKLTESLSTEKSKTSINEVVITAKENNIRKCKATISRLEKIKELRKKREDLFLYLINSDDPDTPLK